MSAVPGKPSLKELNGLPASSASVEELAEKLAPHCPKAAIAAHLAKCLGRGDRFGRPYRIHRSKWPRLLEYVRDELWVYNELTLKGRIIRPVEKILTIDHATVLPKPTPALYHLTLLGSVYRVDVGDFEVYERKPSADAPPLYRLPSLEDVRDAVRFLEIPREEIET